MIDPVSSEMGELQRVAIRPALPMDTAAVMELSGHIWEGEDYIPLVWNDWLADPHGLLAVAECGGRAVGLIKLTRLSDQDWWLEGLRVHPQYAGRKIASRLHDYIVDVWQNRWNGALRLVTPSFRYEVHHLSERTGFKRVMEAAPFKAAAVPGQPAPFTPLEAGEIPAALEFAGQSRLPAFSAGLIDLGWSWAPLRRDFLQAAIANRLAFWWRAREGLLLLWEDEDEQDRARKIPFISSIACPLEKLSACLGDFRRLSASLGYQDAEWNVPLRAELLPALEEAGYIRNWEDSLFIYEKDHS
jgi:GNAT superfamily N-acetyltransferase